TTNAFNVFIGSPSTNLVALPSPYSGLSATIENCEVSASATPIGQRFNVPATVDETFEVASIPIFQFLIFYNLNLEIDAGQPLVAVGPVFSNGSMWTGATDVTFSNTVWCVGTNVNGGSDPFAYSYSGSGPSVFKYPGQPVTGVTSLTLPVAGINNTNNNATNIESLLQWPPSTYALGSANAYTTNGQVYLANAADLIISNSPTGTNWGSLTPAGTNFTVYYQDPNLSPSLTNIPYDFYIITNSKLASAPRIYLTNYIAPNVLGTNANGYTNILYAGYTFLTNVLFYDWREGWNGGSGVNGKGKPVQAVQFSVTNFNAWLSNTNINGTTNINGGKYFNTLCNSGSHKSHPIDGIYIYTSVPFTTSCLPAVRVINGARLYDSHGLTFATPFPIYVLGDYNTMDGVGSNAGQNTVNHTRPAGLLCDAITILSSSWLDSVTNSVLSGNSP
ncbi:MAG TPA: hypothetical protein VKJ65_09650, partial [Phycisphaerae bacterium]|nr:hypothetical protein [Phycisphaerae bacterium]